MSYEAKLREIGLRIPSAPRPVAAYVPSVQADGFVYTSGQLPFAEGELKYKGKVGQEITTEQAYEAAQVCALNCLSVVRAQTGSLDKVERVIKVTGFVNSAPGFDRQPQVINGASELLGKIFGAAGQHARSAVGVSELPLGAPVEVEMIVKIKE